MTTEDGTQFTADIGSMIPVLTFEDSATIAVSVTGTGKNKTYSFSIKTGSVTDDMLQPNYLADIRVESANASAYAQSANAKSVLAESYAVGGTGTREGEDTDNAKYYMEQAKQQTGGIPTKVSELENDVGYITKKVSDLTNYYDKTSVDKKIDAIPKTYLTNYLTKTGDGSNLTAVFEEATTLEELTTGEKLSSIFGKLKLAVKNLKSLIGLIGTTDISTIGDGTITGGLSDVNGKLNQNTDLTLVNCVSWESDNTISKIGNRVFVTLGVQITSEQSSGSLIIASIARTYYPKTTYVRANAAGGTNGDNHMLYINKSNGAVILNLSTERYYSASFSYLAN
jgi:hypothetical protein